MRKPLSRTWACLWCVCATLGAGLPALGADLAPEPAQPAHWDSLEWVRSRVPEGSVFRASVTPLPLNDEPAAAGVPVFFRCAMSVQREEPVLVLNPEARFWLSVWSEDGRLLTQPPPEPEPRSAAGDVLGVPAVECGELPVDGPPQAALFEQAGDYIVRLGLLGREGEEAPDAGERIVLGRAGGGHCLLALAEARCRVEAAEPDGTERWLWEALCAAYPAESGGAASLIPADLAEAGLLSFQDDAVLPYLDAAARWCPRRDYCEALRTLGTARAAALLGAWSERPGRLGDDARRCVADRGPLDWVPPARIIRVAAP